MTEQEKKNGVVQPQQQQQPQAPTQEQINASAANSASKGASSTTGFTYNGFQGVSSQHDQQHVTDANDLARIEQLSAQAKYANAMGDAATVAKVHAEAEAIRNKYNYTGDVNDSQGYEYAALPQNNGTTTPKIQPYSYTPQFGDALDRWYAAAQAQQMGQVDYATNTGVNELVRAEQDAQAQFQTQRNQIAIDEAKAKDNQALYAEARGDKGGIGAAQYDSIMNTAAQNRLAVNSAQTKLATDTSRQIADLRAKGEFEKADALLTLSQQYLSQLISLEQWAAEFGLSVAQFNASLQQWEAEFELAVGETMGSYQGKPTLGAQQFQFNQQQYADELAMTQKNQLSEDGWLFLQSGIMPSASQLEAMGMTASQAQTILTSQKLAASSGGSGGGRYASGNDEIEDTGISYQSVWNKGYRTQGDAYLYFTSEGYTDTEAKRLSGYFMDWVTDNNMNLRENEGTISDKSYATYRKSIISGINNQGWDATYNLVGSIWWQLSPAQRNDVNALLDQVGKHFDPNDVYNDSYHQKNKK